jgi:ubiquinone/menaquinone biosynthesis C-methylase UbiE
MMEADILSRKLERSSSRFSDPKSNIEQFGLHAGMSVADFGSGSGHYTLAASEAVGESGRVYAIDIQQELLKKVKNLSRSERKNNIEVIWGDIEEDGGTKLRDGAVDAVIISNVLFQADDKDTAVAEAKRVLKPKGRLLLIDWSDSFGNIGPMEENVVRESEAKRLFERSGFEYVRDIDAGRHHYGLVFRRTSP